MNIMSIGTTATFQTAYVAKQFIAIYDSDVFCCLVAGYSIFVSNNIY